jgi:SAM-dependent methyltransferase
LDFICNVCGTHNTGVETFGREVPNCTGCLSTVRIRALLYAFSQELFGAPLLLRDFPALKGLRGVGMTDSDSYAKILAEKFDYRNTFFDRDPRLDITEFDARDEGTLDFLISSEVFEHVKPPFEKALENALRFLRPNGVLILTVPYAPQGPAIERFPQFEDAGLVQLRGGAVLVNRTAQGDLQVFDKLIFHGGAGSTLEMRRLSEADLRSALLAAGFTGLRFYTEDYAPFGVRHTESWSLPVAARKQPFSFSASVRADLMRQFGELRQEISRLCARLEHEAGQNAELHNALAQRTEWAHGLEDELKAEREIIAQLQADLVSRTEWARDLERQLEEATNSAAALAAEVESRTKWAQDLDGQFQERTAWALQLNHRTEELDRELRTLRAAKWNRLGRLLRLLP